MFMTERETLQELITQGLTTDGGHHKQWFLQQIAYLLEITIDADYEPGVAP